MLTSELTVHMLKCVVRGQVCCPLIHDSSFTHLSVLARRIKRLGRSNSIHFIRRRIFDFYCIGGFELNSSELNSTIGRLINRALNQSFLYCLSSEIVLLICKPNSSFELHGQTSSTACGRLLVFGRLTREKFNMQNFSSVALRFAHA